MFDFEQRLIWVYDKFDKWRILSSYYPIRGGIASIQHIER